jgi:putative ABC transport system permease protein
LCGARTPACRVDNLVDATSLLDRRHECRFFLPNSQIRENGLTLVVRTAGDPLRAAAAVERAIHQVDAELPVYNARTMDQLMAGSYAKQRFETGLLEAFALIALVLAALGIYGVTSYTVSQRTSEIGVRIALGARRSNVVSIVLGGALIPSLIGLGIGAAGAIAAAGAMRSMLFGVSGADPLTLFGVAAIFLFTTALACTVPAWRAMRVDPIEALRAE